MSTPQPKDESTRLPFHGLMENEKMGKLENRLKGDKKEILPPIKKKRGHDSLLVAGIGKISL